LDLNRLSEVTFGGVKATVHTVESYTQVKESIAFLMQISIGSADWLAIGGTYREDHGRS
jgi:hypothetical protein